MRPVFNPSRGADGNKIQDEIQRTVLQLSESTSGVLLQGRAIATTETPVRHGLGRVPLGWRPYSPADFANIKQTKAPDSVFVYLAASSAVTCGIEVF